MTHHYQWRWLWAKEGTSVDVAASDGMVKGGRGVEKRTKVSQMDQPVRLCGLFLVKVEDRIRKKGRDFHKPKHDLLLLLRSPFEIYQSRLVSNIVVKVLYICSTHKVFSHIRVVSYGEIRGVLAGTYTWYQSEVKSIMDAYGLWGTVEPRGLGEEPEEKKSKQALAFLFQAIPEDMVLQMASYTDPKQVWDGLKTRFLGVDRVRTSRLATLRKELENMRMKEGEAVDDFVAKLNGIASKVRSLGYELEEVDLVKRLPNSMPKPFFQIVASIEQCFDLDSMFFDEAVGRLKAFEERLKGLGEKEEEQGQVLMAEHKYGESSGQGRGHGRSYGRGERGRGSQDRGRGGGYGGKIKSRFRCFDCGEFGHFGYECTKWKDTDEANLIQDEEPALL
ncbi:putative zinc finger, CCHC-type containing protein [Tanacetum coccineum]